MFIMASDKHNDERLKSKLSERVLELESFGVEFVTDNRSEIINKMTLILERKLMKYLEEIKTKLFDYSRTHTVGSRFFEVNAILRRLKQAACYPEALTDEIEDDEKQNKMKSTEFFIGLEQKNLNLIYIFHHSYQLCYSMS